jgi:hypothetical protein
MIFLNIEISVLPKAEIKHLPRFYPNVLPKTPEHHSTEEEEKTPNQMRNLYSEFGGETKRGEPRHNEL